MKVSSAAPRHRLLATVVLSCALMLPLGCTQSGGDESSASSSAAEGNNSPTPVGQLLPLFCGAIQNNTLTNPLFEDEGSLVQINRIIDPNLIVVSDFTGATSGNRLVQIQGIAIKNEKRDLALQSMAGLIGAGATVFEANGSCPTSVAGGGSGVLATVVLANGKSIAEELVRADFVNVSGGDACGGAALSQCLAGIAGDNEQTAGELESFLWKPTSDSDGKLAVHTGPFGTTVRVNGETGANRGPGNGFGSLARFSKQGCGYGSARIQVLDASGLAYTVGGQTTFTIIDPCQRNCIRNGRMAICPK